MKYSLQIPGRHGGIDTYLVGTSNVPSVVQAARTLHEQSERFQDHNQTALQQAVIKA